jgi:hypothetical protein
MSFTRGTSESDPYIEQKYINNHINNQDAHFKADLNTIGKYIQDNYVQLMLLLGMFILIYCIESLTRINNVLYSIPSAIPGISIPSNASIKSMKKIKHKKIPTNLLEFIRHREKVSKQNQLKESKK